MGGDALARVAQLQVLLHGGDDHLHELCCQGGWDGDGSHNGGGGPAVRIPRRDLDRMEQTWGHVFCRFRVRGSELITCDPAQVEELREDREGRGEVWGQYEAIARVSRILLANGLLPDGLDFFVSPQIFDAIDVPVPVLSKARAAFARGPIRVPSFELLGPRIDQVRRDLRRVEWHTKISKLYWRGGMRSFNACPCHPERLVWPRRWQDAAVGQLLATQHPPPGSCHNLPISTCRSGGVCRCHRHITNQTTFSWSNRVRLCELSRAHPELVDAKLSYVPEGTYASIVATCQKRGFLANFSRFDDHTRYRYLMSTDGSTIDDTRVYWMLSSGSVVFKQITPLLPYGLPGLQPWVHFVPVREDLADVLEKVRWARSHDTECEAIAARAQAFAAEHFNEMQTLHYVQKVLSRYAEKVEPL
eukprot:gnl/TRDRNA2_/TRDRNA2_94267_c0_seq1.p1 gnl/TRDRNA2_/TRDRNA2_94267_c0~~gnl/TRDRNA2_/TRDRNA2_94267_c0_seq1.p1  ORF type:complete len:462 (+),score=75.66 gnl/TRDRNA2_/TRDRNA2_94267_c0_seq1:136-1386(+)